MTSFAVSIADPRLPALRLAALLMLVILAVSGWMAGDKPTWLLETLPVMIAVPLLAFTHRRYPLTTLLYVLAFLHCLVLIYGGIYTYAETPFGFWLRDWLGTVRNPYDKIGHFMQGFVPAVAAREILLRGRHVRGPRMLAFLVLCVVMAISACYELIEWGVALLSDQAADAFLGTQGDPWDTQSDMGFALLGGIAALTLLPGVHDRQLQRLPTVTAAAAPAQQGR
ncbi:MAG: DUF2238 domain-containing protein [Brachymonas denitrificans]|uniref:DUF2238 domain-containing protein n=1 Tax=Brachymonas denitrificans TaxID=28220 RepID=UPI001BD00627|nr:DUF2238 domain-containing protein [Brachymonas denitrificans]